MQMQTVSEQAYLAACMTFDGMRQETLLHRAIGEQYKQKTEELEAKIEEQNTELVELGAVIKELEKTVAQKEEIISDHWGTEIEAEVQTEVGAEEEKEKANKCQ